MYSSTDQFVLLPALMLALFGCAALLLDVFAPRQKSALPWITLLGLAFTGAALWRQGVYLAAAKAPELLGFDGGLVIDRFSLAANALLTISTALVTLISRQYWHAQDEPGRESYALLLFAQCGMFFLASGRDLVTIFLGLELMALSFYILVGLFRRRRESNEAALKYLLLGGFSSGLLAYGFSLLFGISGATGLTEIGAAVAAHDRHDPLLLIALAAISVGLLFKISAVPFHMWAPDAYDGAPVNVTAYLAVASKAASVAVLLRLLLGPLAGLRDLWTPVIAVVAVATLTIGNLAAVGQDNVKRLLAYSSVAHVGYILLGLVAGNQTGLDAIAIYVLTYSIMTLGVFFCVAALSQRGRDNDGIAAFTGLIRRSPWTAVLLLLFLLSLAGLPPTAGFWGKYYVFLALLETGHPVLAVISVLYVAVSAFYYFRIVRYVFAAPDTFIPPLLNGWGMRAALGIAGTLTLWIGVFPEPFLRLAKGSILR